MTCGVFIVIHRRCMGEETDLEAYEIYKYNATKQKNTHQIDHSPPSIPATSWIAFGSTVCSCRWGWVTLFHSWPSVSLDGLRDPGSRETERSRMFPAPPRPADSNGASWWWTTSMPGAWAGVRLAAPPRPVECLQQRTNERTNE